MTIYIAGRQTGKTSFLIRESARTGAVIIAPTAVMAEYIDSMARKMGLKIPAPILIMDWVQRVARGQVSDHDPGYLLDELQMALHQMNVSAATLDKNYKEEVRMFGVKETCCTRCAHREVCQYKEEFLAAQHAVDGAGIRLPSKDENVAKGSILIRDIPWIKPVELRCKYFQQNTGMAR